MATVVLPAGVVPVRSLTTEEILTGNRLTRVRLDLLSRTEASLGELTGVRAGKVEQTANASIKGAGSIDVTDAGQPVDWLNDRIRPVVMIEGIPEFALGVFIAAETPEKWAGTGRSWAVKLLDKTSILDKEKIPATYALEAGTVITSTVAALIASTGETNIAVTPSAATLPSPLAWNPTTSKLKIVNDLLAVAGYYSLFCDSSGQYRGEPYARPAVRPIRWEFLDSDRGIYAPDFERDIDLYSIPNRFTAVGQGDGTTEALVATATNEDPASPYSYPSRGRWIDDGATGVEAADQETLDAYARRRLIELTSPTSSVAVRHALVPGLTANDVVRFRRVPAGIDARHVVIKTEISFDPTALVKSTLREVVDL
jgi:hypothetical protein